MLSWSEFEDPPPPEEIRNRLDFISVSFETSCTSLCPREESLRAQFGSWCYLKLRYRGLGFTVRLIRSVFTRFSLITWQIPWEIMWKDPITSPLRTMKSPNSYFSMTSKSANGRSYAGVTSRRNGIISRTRSFFSRSG